MSYSDVICPRCFSTEAEVIRVTRKYTRACRHNGRLTDLHTLVLSSFSGLEGLDGGIRLSCSSCGHVWAEPLDVKPAVLDYQI